MSMLDTEYPTISQLGGDNSRNLSPGLMGIPLVISGQSNVPDKPRGPKIDARRPEYDRMILDWMTCRDAKEGERAVKERGPTYLPQLEDQENDDYESYRMRAAFFGATQRTVEGYAGALFNQPPTIKAPPKILEALKTIGAEEESFDQVLDECADELMTVGRVGLLVDADPDVGDPYVTLYTAESIINWKTEDRKGQCVLSLLVLEEAGFEQGDDGYEWGLVMRYRVMRLVDNQCVVTVYEKHEREDANGKTYNEFLVIGDPVTLKKKAGAAIDYIPFTFINATTITTRVTKPPLLDLANINIAHYRNSADYEHGCHYTALPTPYIIGLQTTNTPTFKLGSRKAWKIGNPQASVGFVEFTGQGLKVLENAMDKKERQMATIAARFLEPPKKAAEAARTVDYRRTGDTATLSGIAKQMSAGGTQVLEMIADWLLDSDQDVTVAMSQDFDDFTLYAQEIIALNALVQEGKLWYGDFFAALQRAKYIPADRTYEENVAKIKADPGPANPMLDLGNSGVSTSSALKAKRPNPKKGGGGKAKDGDHDGIVNEGKNGNGGL